MSSASLPMGTSIGGRGKIAAMLLAKANANKPGGKLLLKHHSIFFNFKIKCTFCNISKGDLN